MTPDLARQMGAWRHSLHRKPELGFQEQGTAAFVSAQLEALGLTVHGGIGGTGLVASLRCGDGPGVIGLRADMDALAMTETGSPAHASEHPGCMHGCGHDGHMAMVLGAAALLTERRDFNGTVRFIFQPAEEHGRGAKAMMADGLFERFPVDAIFGLHNMPGLPLGHFAGRAGGIMAAEDNFEIRITGRGGHAARPHMGVDPLVVAAQIILGLQTIVSRSVDPSATAVVSCTEIESDGIRNAIPTTVVLKGDTRSYDPAVQALLEARMRTLCEGLAAAQGASVTVSYTHEFSPTVNWVEQTAQALRAAEAVVGGDKVDSAVAPMMISEDFGAFLEAVPGAFLFLGAGEDALPLHNSAYDFNDALLPLGAEYFATLARQLLPAGEGA
jgi:hippurate hydrolase